MRFKLAKKFSEILGSYVDPSSVNIYCATGYWTHMHQDCMRFTGNFPRPDMPSLTYDFGSWEPLSVLDRKKFVVTDERNTYRADANFMVSDGK